VTRVLTPAGDYAVNFVSGISNGDAQLVRALNEATFSVPGSVNMNTINRLSPESHHGMADYAEEALHSHVRQAIEAPTLARNGNTQLFASLHSTTAGVDDDITKAGYDIDSAGATLGMRHDMTEQFQAGFLLGLDSGSISGSHIDTDAEGFAFGAFARIVADEKSKTIVTGSASFGNYSYDATRSSFEGDVEADGIGASAVELSLGVSTVIYEKENVTLSPNATLRYVNGSVDGFDEEGTGVELVVGSQDISSVIIDLGLDASIKLDEKVTFNGRVGYMHELSSSEEPITASFAATGANAVPFTVNAPGIDHQAFVLGLGLSFDLNDSATLGLSYRGEYRFDSQASQNVGLGVSFGF
jgi:outer membrane autotransporter protein